MRPGALTLDIGTSVADVQRMVNEVLGLATPANDLSHDGTVK
jgi:hypothetical protein